MGRVKIHLSVVSRCVLQWQMSIRINDKRPDLIVCSGNGIDVFLNTTL